MNNTKIFKKVRRRDLRDIYLFGKKILTYSRKSKKVESFDLSMFEYLDGYKNILNKNLNEDCHSVSSDSSEQINDKSKKEFLFQYWNSGEDNAPAFVKACFRSIDRNCSNLNIVRLSDDNFQEYADIPDFIMEKYKAGKISKTHFSDYLRTCLLIKNGGYWCDATVYMTGPIPEDISSSDFFMFKSSSFSMLNDRNKGYVPSMSMLDVLKDHPFPSDPSICGSSWFLHSKHPNLRLLKLVKLILDEYWRREDHLINYFLFHYVLTYVVIHDELSRNTYASLPNLCNFNPHLLLSILYDHFDKDLFSEISLLSPVHKLTYQKHADIEGTFIEFLLNQN